MNVKTKAMQRWAGMQERAEEMREENERNKKTAEYVDEFLDEIEPALNFAKMVGDSVREAPSGGGVLITKDLKIRIVEKIEY